MPIKSVPLTATISQSSAGSNSMLSLEGYKGGRAQVQVVDDFGQPVFDDELQQDQILTVPQNFAVVKRASSEGFEWVAFKTNDRAQISPLAGRASVLRAIPADVLANAFQLSQEDVSELKVNMERQGNTLIRPSRSSSQRRAIA
nr:13s globulin basic chain [Quercus suber]